MPEDNLQETQTPEDQTGQTASPQTPPQIQIAPPAPERSRRRLLLIVAIIVLVLGGGTGWWLTHRRHETKQQSNTNTVTTSSQSASKNSTSTQNLPGLQLDPNKNYGNKYADGVLPVGDGKYTTSGAKKGYVYACSQYAQNLATDNGGADTRGPWFTNNNTEYNINKKVHVSGAVTWHSSFSDKLSGNARVIVTNDLPMHTTGIYPIASTDSAYSYDRNPNSIKSQSLTYDLTANPSYGSANCAGGEVGIMLTGVALFSAFDAGGRDAGAWEVQDSCSGHPQSSGEYHYHTLSSCIKDTSVSTVIGFALDGFPITGPKVGTNNYLATSDLDECHGITSQITLDGKKTTMYHYVMTQDFPYSISCFRAKAINPPGQQEGTGTQQQTSGGPNTLPPPRRP